MCKFQLPSSNHLGMRVFQRFRRKIITCVINYLVHYGAVYRTAPATPGRYRQKKLTIAFSDCYYVKCPIIILINSIIHKLCIYSAC